MDLKLKGRAALITGGSFYRLENTGAGPMILMGHRSGSQDTVKIIDYVTRKDIRDQVKITISLQFQAKQG